MQQPRLQKRKKGGQGGGGCGGDPSDVRRSAHLLRLWRTSSSWCCCSSVSPAPARAGPAVDPLRRRWLVAVDAELGGQLPAPRLALGLVPGDLLLQARSLSLEVGLLLWWGGLLVCLYLAAKEGIIGGGGGAVYELDCYTM